MLSSDLDKKRWFEDYISPAIERRDVDNHANKLKKTMGEQEILEDAAGIDEDETESEEDNDQPRRKYKSNPPKKKIPTKKAKASKVKKRDQEAAQAEALMAKIRNKSSLANRQAGFDSMLSGIKKKYAVAQDDPLGDDEFEQIQARMEAQRKQKGGRKTSKR